MDRVGPYLTHVVKHHGQTTLIPPQNAGKIRSAKDGKHRKGIKNELSHKSGLSEPHEDFKKRHTPNEYEDIPSYPPPSFEEATCVSSSSICPLDNRTVTCNASSSTPSPSTSRTQNYMHTSQEGSMAAHFKQLFQNRAEVSNSSLAQGPFHQIGDGIQLPVRINHTVQMQNFPHSRPPNSDLVNNISISSTQQHFAPISDLEFTELDIYLSRLDNDDSVANGDNYHDLLALSEIMGSANDSTVRMHDFDLPIGKIEVERRRVMKDGRVKIKLSFLGLAVDKCSICLVQFKKDDFAALTTCEHAFHERCMRSWLLRSKTCPLCRQVVVT